VSSQYFCPALSVVANFLRMTPDLAGLTLLALGNGSTDVSSIFVAVTTNNFGIAAGEIFGAGVFVTTVVVAIVSMVRETALLKYSFLRDVLFYFGGVLGASLLINDGDITLWKALLLLAYYLLYVASALIMSYCRCFCPQMRSQHVDVNIEGSTVEEIEMLVMNSDNDDLKPNNDTNDEGDTLSRRHSEQNLRPAEQNQQYFSWNEWKEEWKRKKNHQKVVYVMTKIVTLPLLLTIPESHQWNRINAVLVPTFSPLPIMAAFGLLSKITRIGTVEVPVWVFIEIGGILVSFVVYFTTHTKRPPVYLPLFTFWAFSMSILWIYIFAHELIRFLTSLGTILGVSTVILGATILAWGNSVPDLVADVLLAKKGDSHMALTGAYATPAFNLLFGMGMSFTYMCIRHYPDSYRVLQLDRPLFFLSGTFLLAILLISLFVIPLYMFRIPRKFSFLLLIFYLLFIILAVLTEFKLVFK